MSNNESKIVVKPSEHAPLEPQILRNVEQAIIARHTTKCSFEHLEEVDKPCAKAYILILGVLVLDMDMYDLFI